MIQLYSYYRSTASYRIRIALLYKKIDFQIIPVNLIKNEQLETAYLKHNPQGRIPMLVNDNLEIGQSSAILEYLEEKFPENPLLPKDINARAWVRFLSQIIISDMHPLNNLSSLKYLESTLHLDKLQIKAWYHHWLKKGFDTLENILKNHPECQNFCWGDNPTFADICLIPQIYNAVRFEFNMSAYPTLMKINQHCLELPYFELAVPERQPDFPEASAENISS